MADTLTDEEIAELERLHDALPWPAPWSARTFDIDCPCPNGEHCGDTHSCAEVEACEAYPNGAPGDAAAEGYGQCVVQIATPGLERFAMPCAEFIAAARNQMARLLATIAALKSERDTHAATLERLLGCGSCVSEPNAEDGCPCAHAPCIHTPNRLHRERDAAIAERDEAEERACCLRGTLADITAFNECRDKTDVGTLTTLAVRSLASDGGKSEETKPGCKRCGKPLPTTAHVFCGSACSARWEAGDRGDGGEGRG